MSPITIAEGIRVAGAADGQTSATHYLDVPIAHMAKHLYFEVSVSHLDGGTTLSFDLEDSVTGDVWESTLESFSDITSDEGKIFRTDKSFANRARLKVEIVGDSSTQRFATLRVSVAGKPF